MVFYEGQVVYDVYRGEPYTITEADTWRYDATDGHYAESQSDALKFAIQKQQSRLQRAENAIASGQRDKQSATEWISRLQAKLALVDRSST
jgi:hypothetical protein